MIRLATRILTACGVALVAFQVEAADLYQMQPQQLRVAPRNWSGGYVGVHVGTGSLTVDGVGSVGKLDGTGVIYGGQAGYNWQVGRFVIGAEFDASLASATDKANTSIAGVSGHLSVGADSVLSIRLKGGYAVGPALVYATAGVAAVTINGEFPANSAIVDMDDAALGYVVGGGAAWRLTENISARAEALYHGLSGEVTLAGTKSDIDANFLSLRTGLDFHF